MEGISVAERSEKVKCNFPSSSSLLVVTVCAGTPLGSVVRFVERKWAVQVQHYANDPGSSDADRAMVVGDLFFGGVMIQFLFIIVVLDGMWTDAAYGLRV